MRKLKPVVFDRLFYHQAWGVVDTRVSELISEIINQAYFHIDDKVWDNVGNVILINTRDHIWSRLNEKT